VLQWVACRSLEWLFLKICAFGQATCKSGFLKNLEFEVLGSGSVLQCVAVCCSMLRCVARYGLCMVWCVAVCCGVFHCVAVCFIVLQSVVGESPRVLQCGAVCCSELQCVAS